MYLYENLYIACKLQNNESMLPLLKMLMIITYGLGSLIVLLDVMMAEASEACTPEDKELTELTREAFVKIAEYLNGELEGEEKCNILSYIISFLSVAYFDVCQTKTPWFVFGSFVLQTALNNK